MGEFGLSLVLLIFALANTLVFMKKPLASRFYGRDSSLSLPLLLIVGLETLSKVILVNLSLHILFICLLIHCFLYYRLQNSPFNQICG